MKKIIGLLMFLFILSLTIFSVTAMSANSGTSSEGWTEEKQSQPDCECQQKVILIFKIRHPVKKNLVRYEQLVIRTSAIQGDIGCSQILRQFHSGLIGVFIRSKHFFVPYTTSYPINHRNSINLFIEERARGLVLKYDLNTHRGKKKGVKFRGEKTDEGYQKYFISIYKEFMKRVLD